MSDATIAAPTTPAPGLHHVKYEEYAGWNAVNHSTLRLFNRTPAHARESMINPEPQTKALAMGHATHLAILEPERFDAEVAKAPKADRRYKAGKRIWAEFTANNVGMTILTAEEYDLCRALRDAVWSHTTARELLKGNGINEASLAWADEGTGIPCKARLDRLTSLASWPVIVDLKTCEDASRRGFERCIYAYHYHQQGAFYLDGCYSIAPHDRKYMFIAVEKVRPYCVAVYELEDVAIDLGRDAYRKHLRTYAECMRTGVFPGYAEGADLVSLPAWALKFHGEDGG